MITIRDKYLLLKHLKRAKSYTKGLRKTPKYEVEDCPIVQYLKSPYVMSEDHRLAKKTEWWELFDYITKKEGIYPKERNRWWEQLSFKEKEIIYLWLKEIMVGKTTKAKIIKRGFGL